MKIVLVDRGNPIPALNYGGTERVIWGLGFELSKLGHKVTFIVPKGSVCPFANVLEYFSDININALIPKDTDIVHLSFVPDCLVEYPHIITMHGNNIHTDKFDLNTVFISKDHAIRHHSDVFVYNGLLWNDYPKVNLSYKREYYHFLAKASWKIKNLAGAAKIAVKSNNRLSVMGGEKWKFYNIKRNPFYTLNPKVSYFGQVDNEKKIKIMEKSKGLIFPVLWDEPFGLAIIESLYAGCPVFGTKRGSLPELINEDIGFVSDNENELIDALREKKFSPQICHEHAIKYFSSEVMTKKYLVLYDKILHGETLNKTMPYVS
jgi:glycosyltransferase involved in cell wall biosynthesis